MVEYFKRFFKNLFTAVFYFFSRHTALGAVIVVGLAIIFANSLNKSGYGEKEIATNTPKVETPEKKAENQRESMALTVAKTLQKNAKDPSSFDPTYIGVSEDGYLVCVEYRAKNSFGAYDMGFMSFDMGTFSESATKCNKASKNKQLYDVTGVTSYMLKRF